MAKKKRIKKATPKSSQELQHPFSYRVLARQPLSVEFVGKLERDLTIQRTRCRIAIRPEHADAALKQQHGGTICSIEFVGDIADDLISMARHGLLLLEDFLSAISLVSGTPFPPSTLLQVAP